MGVITYVANDEGIFLAQTLWKVRIGGGELGRGVVPLNLKGLITPDENWLIVGANDAAFQPGDGQPGEDIDKHGGPVPRP